jgi:hypothetical protein
MNLLYRICSRHDTFLKLALSTNQSIIHMPSNGVLPLVYVIYVIGTTLSVVYHICSFCDYRLVWYIRVLLIEQELPTLPEHLSSSPVLNGVRVTRSLVSCVCFVNRCLSFCTFYFGHCVVCSSSIYGFWLTLWYLQAFHTNV